VCESNPELPMVLATPGADSRPTTGRASTEAGTHVKVLKKKHAKKEEEAQMMDSEQLGAQQVSLQMRDEPPEMESMQAVSSMGQSL
jgi:hypothetical protein